MTAFHSLMVFTLCHKGPISSGGRIFEVHDRQEGEETFNQVFVYASLFSLDFSADETHQAAA